jgi:hypothetical protein
MSIQHFSATRKRFRYDSEIVRYHSEIVRYDSEIVSYNPENTVSASHGQWQYRDEPKTFSDQDSFIMQ